MKRLMLVLMVLFVFLVDSPSFAQRGGGWGGPPGGGSDRGGPPGGEQGRGMPGGGNVSDPTAIPDFQIIDLSLSVEQTSKIITQRASLINDIKPIQSEMLGKRDTLKLIWQEKDPDQEKIAAIKKEIKALRDRMQEKISDYMLEVRSILTAEQYFQLRAGWSGLGGGKSKEAISGKGQGDGAGNGLDDSGDGRGQSRNW
jgi:Spy/CpxP family protein refolding chaperone